MGTAWEDSPGRRGKALPLGSGDPGGEGVSPTRQTAPWRQTRLGRRLPGTPASEAGDKADQEERGPAGASLRPGRPRRLPTW